jgi:hypothetical protein
MSIGLTRTPAATVEDLPQLIKRIQHALIDGHVVTLGSLGRLVLAQRNDELPASEGDDKVYGAAQSGVFREVEGQRGEQTFKKWLRYGHLDELDDILGPELKRLPKADVEGLSVGLTFQVVMTQDANDRQTRRFRRR